jgi:hypothetical protein
MCGVLFRTSSEDDERYVKKDLKLYVREAYQIWRVRVGKNKK